MRSGDATIGGQRTRHAAMAVTLAIVAAACSSNAPDAPASPTGRPITDEDRATYSANALASLEAFPLLEPPTLCFPEGLQFEYQWFRTERTLVVDPRNPERLLVAVERLGLYESLDRGETWSPMSTTGIVFDMRKTDGTVCLKETTGFLFDPYVPGRIYLSFGGTGSIVAGAWQARGSGVYVSDDDGQTWVLLTRPEMSSYVMSVTPDPFDPETVFVGSSAAALTSDGADPNEFFIDTGIVYRIDGVADGGTSWEVLPTGWSAETGAQLLWADPATRGRLVMGVAKEPVDVVAGNGLGSGWYESLDGGMTWNELGTGTGHGLFVANAAISRDGDSLLFRPQFVEEEWVYVSDDGGRSWEALDVRLVAPTYDPIVPSRAYAVLDVRLGEGPNPFVRSDDGGRTWEEIGTLPPEFATNLNNEPPVKRRAMPTKIVVDPSDPDVIYVSGAGGLIARSDDGGATWILLTTWRSFPPFGVLAR